MFACCLAMPLAGVIAISVASIADATVAAAASFVVYLTLAAYIVRFLSTNPAQETPQLLDDLHSDAPREPREALSRPDRA